jgi:hypothetical protein
VGDLKNTPVPNGPHTKVTVVNGNTTTNAMTTQPAFVGNGPPTESTTATPSYPVDKKDRLGYAQVSPPVAVAVGDLKHTPVPTGPHTTKTVVNGNTTTDGITTQPFYIGNAVSSGTTTATPKYPVPSKDELGYAQKSTPNQTSKKQTLAEESHSDSDSGEESDSNKDLVDPKNFI